MWNETSDSTEDEERMEVIYEFDWTAWPVRVRTHAHTHACVCAHTLEQAKCIALFQSLSLRI